MAYFDINKTAGTDTTSEASTIFDHLAKFIMAPLGTTAKRPGKSPADLIAARHRAEAHRRAVDRLMR